jgi:hypothetical protein
MHADDTPVLLQTTTDSQATCQLADRQCTYKHLHAVSLNAPPQLQCSCTCYNTITKNSQAYNARVRTTMHHIAKHRKEQQLNNPLLPDALLSEQLTCKHGMSIHKPTTSNKSRCCIH